MSVKRHTVYNLIGSLVPLGLSLVTIPTYLSIIGESRYGVLAIAWLLLGYFGLFDLGLGRATARHIASLGDSSKQEVSTTFWTALTVNMVLGVVGGLIIWPVSIYLFENFFKFDAILRSELSTAIPWLALAVPLSTISGVLTGSLQGRSKFLEINIISVVNSAMVQILPLSVAILLGPNLSLLLPAAILARLLGLALLIISCRTHVIAGCHPSICRPLMKKLLQFGGWITVSSIISPMMVVFDRFFIGATLGAAHVAYYTVPFQLAQRSSVLAGAMTSALFPRLAALSEIDRIKMAGEATRILAVVMTPAIMVALVLVGPFFTWWLGSNFAAKSTLTAQILLLGFWVNSFARVPYTQLQAAGLPRVTAILHIIELLPYFVFLYVGIHNWGLPGAAVAFGLRNLVDALLLSLLAGTFRNNAIILYFPIFLILCSFISAVFLVEQKVLMSIIFVILMLISLTWSYLNLPHNTRVYVKLAVRKII